MMSNEELERIMNLIIERQERSSVQIERIIEAQGKLTEAQDRLAAQQAGHEERIARFERSYVAIAQLLEKHDAQLDAVTEGLNNVTIGLNAVTDELAKLTRLVTSYIAARGDGSNGGA